VKSKYWFQSLWTEGATYYQLIYNAGIYYGVSGIPMPGGLYEAGDQATVSTSIPSCPGMDFLYWSRYPSGEAPYYLPGQKITFGKGDITLYPVFVNQTVYTITYYGNGNSDGEAPLEMRCLSGEQATVHNQNTLTKDGYYFDGWNTQPDGSGTTYQPGDGIQVGSENVKLYAVWTELPPDLGTEEEEETYAVTYISYGHTGGVVPKDTSRYSTGATVTLTDSVTLWKEGHVLYGWMINGMIYSPGGTFTINDSNVTAYAVWASEVSEETFTTVSFSGNGNMGGTVPDGVICAVGNSVVLPDNTGNLTRAGYAFGGWTDNVDINKPGQEYCVKSPEKITLYAAWIPVKTMTYYGNGSTGGSAPAESAQYAMGETVTVLGNINNLVRDNCLFAGWFIRDRIYQPGETFVMPAENIVASAVWAPLNTAPPPSGGSSGNVRTEEGTDTDSSTDLNNEVIISGNTVTVVSKVASNVDENGRVAVEIQNEQITGAINSAVSEASQRGGTARVEIRAEVPENSSTVEIIIPQDTVRTANDNALDAIVFSTSVVEIAFDRDTLTAIAQEAAENIRITASRADAERLSEEARQVVGDRPVYEFSVTSGDKVISRFGGYVTVSVPYTPKPDEDVNAIVIYYINAEGKPEIVRDCVYDPAAGTVRFSTNHFSRYALGHNKVRFNDVAESAWYSKAVSFIAARGITQGTGNGNFSPGAKITRGQFIVMLMKAYGLEPDENIEDNFADAGNTYYTGYLAAAKRLGITAGTGNNMFGPDREITRQEMFTMLYNTLKVIGKLPEARGDKTMSMFTDAGEISPWASDAVRYLVQAGMINGSNGRLLPKETATRAQMAQILFSLFVK